MNILESAALGKRYGRTWALRDCTLAIPAGHVVALLGPNGAGKTTLLNMIVGLTAPTAGSITVLGGTPAGSPDAVDRIAFVAQDTPLYKSLPVGLAWVTYRQHRPALTGAAVFLGMASLYLLVTGLQINHAYAQVAACHPAGSAACQQMARIFSTQYWGGGGTGAVSVILLAAATWLVRRRAA